jgi:hypothetical protein
MKSYEEKLIELLETTTNLIISDLDMLEYIDEEEIIEAETRAYGVELAWTDVLNGYFN